jgi:hypothetical protein
MPSIHKTLLIAALLALSVPTAALQISAGEQRSGGMQDTGEVMELTTLQSGGLTLSEAVEQVRRKYGGRIVSAETTVKGKQEVHVIKVLTPDGTVKTENVRGKKLD